MITQFTAPVTPQHNLISQTSISLPTNNNHDSLNLNFTGLINALTPTDCCSQHIQKSHHKEPTLAHKTLTSNFTSCFVPINYSSLRSPAGHLKKRFIFMNAHCLEFVLLSQLLRYRRALCGLSFHFAFDAWKPILATAGIAER